MIDKIKMKLKVDGDFGFNLEKVLSTPNDTDYESSDEESQRRRVFERKKGVYWYFNSGMGVDLGESVDNLSLSLTRLKEGEERKSRIEFFYRYGNQDFPYNDEDFGREHQAGISFAFVY